MKNTSQKIHLKINYYIKIRIRRERMKSLSKRTISLILAVLMIMDVFAPVAAVASTNSTQNNVKVLDDLPTETQIAPSDELIIPATPEDDTLIQVVDPAQNSSQQPSQKPAQEPAQPAEPNQPTEQPVLPAQDQLPNSNPIDVQDLIQPDLNYVSWELVNPGKTAYAKGDMLDLDELRVKVKRVDGKEVVLNYFDIQKDINFGIEYSMKNKLDLKPGNETITIKYPNLEPITININIYESEDQIPQDQKKDELTPAENPNDKKDNIIEGNDQNSPENEIDKNNEDELKGDIFDQLLGKEENQLGFEKFNPLKAFGLNGGASRELTEEELEAGLTKVELPTPGVAPVSPVFNRAAFKSTELLNDTVNDGFGLEMSDEFISAPVGEGNNSGVQIEDGKKFHIITRFDTSTAVGPIKKDQFFKIHLDDALMVKTGTTLEPIKYNNEIIATPSYDSRTNTIVYTIERDINENIQVPLNIPVDFNTANITLDENEEFTVTNKVSGLGVTDPKDLIPNKVNKYGNVTNQIIEPGRKDVTEIIEPDDSNYKVYTDAVADPVVKDRELKGYNWTIKITSDTDLSKLGYKANFTTVKGSGLGEITSRDTTVELSDNPIKGQFGIFDSKHHEPGPGIKEITYNLYTPVTGKQAAYMMDISVILTKTKKDKVGAKRLIVGEAYGINKIAEATPNRVGMNNRTTILGEFANEDTAKWTVTDAVSTGDVETKLPLETRTLGNQTFQSGQVAVYGLNTDGEMVQIGTTSILNSIPGQGTNPTENQAVGNIAVYEYNSTIANNRDPQTLAGVSISKYQDIYVNQNWNLDLGLTMPEMTVKAVDPNNEETVLGEASTTESSANPDPATRKITLENTKVWNIANGGTATRNDIKIKQEFPTGKTDANGKPISYYENNNWKDPNADNTYYIHNRATVETNPQFGNFTLIKTDEKGDALPGAVFKLLGKEEAEVATDAEGKIHFQNIAPGSYQLLETKAPAGYKLSQETTNINVDENGRISASGSSAKLEVGGNPTVTVAHNVYPDFMNAMQYARVNDDGSVTTYIYLKANESKGGSTDKDTRLNLILSSGEKFKNIKDVQVYDVNPYYRDYLRKEMIQQGVNQDVLNHIGNTNVLNAPNTNPIRATLYPRDAYTQKLGYRIRFPQERFNNDWGFLVVANSPAGTSVTYDWLVDGNNDLVGNNARLENQTIRPTTAEDAKKETTLTITNEKFETRPVEVEKIEKIINKETKKEEFHPVVGATFEIRDANDKLISTVDSLADGKASFGDLPEGKYTIEETRAPEGYIKSDVVFDVTVDESNQVTYKPRFKNKPGTPINGEDYYIEDIEQDQDKISAKVTNVSQSLVINEGDSGDIGFRPQVWEAYRLESLKYNATIDLSNTAPGQRFSIQFDRNLDFTQYFGEFPKINVGGVEVADPYFDYTTNKLTYVYNEKSAGGKGQAKIELKGIIPSKYFAQNDGTFPFTVTVAPGQTGVTGQQTITTTVPADYGQYDYDRHNKEVPQSYYFRDVYKEGNDWYVAVLAYYNPDHFRESDPRELKFNWLSTNYQGATKNFFTWEGNGKKPAFSLTNVNVYRTSPNMRTIHAGNFEKKINDNMPLSFGVRPGDDPAKYNLIYSRQINPKQAVRNDRQGGITLNYDPSQIQDFGVITKNSPLRIWMPSINDFSKDGYIIEQTFKIDNLYNFNNLWRVFCMTNNDFKSSFITRANYNKATGDQAGGEIPKFFSQKVALINKKYTPGSFKIKKLNDANREEVLQGASFSLTDEAGNTIYRSSGQDGIVEFSKLKPGIYTLKEESAPDKFIKTDKTWRVNVANDGNVSIVEIGLGSTGETLYGKDTIVLPVTNKPVATEFKVYKKDNENQPLQGAEFKITKAENGTQVATGTSDKNGTVSFNGALENGTYILEETKAPDGYNKIDKKWVLEVGDDKKVKIYNYIEGPKEGTNPEVNKSILGEAGTKWVNVAKRPLTGWVLGDNRQTGYYNNWPVPYRLGTRIVAKNKDKNYVIQRYVLNPEADTITLNNASIHREKPQFTNMDWYAGNEDYKIFELDKAVDGNVEDIRLENYKLKDITNEITKTKENISGQSRLYLKFNNRQITKPIVIDVKVPYKAEEGGVGTGMDLQTNKGLFWKSDYYDRANQIVEGDPVTTTGEAGNIKGAYVSEDALDVTNERIVQEFSFKKVDDGGTDAVTGATFKLQGPKKSDDDLGPEVWKKSGTDGIVKFDKLTPGIYHLTESGAAQGYEKANTDWTVIVTKDNKIYIRDNNPGSTVPDQGAKWQKVDPTKTSDERHTDSYTSNGNPPKIETKITEVNKKENKFRQVYIINRQPENLQNTYFELHAQKENRPINTSNTRIVSVNLVDRSSTFDNLKVTGDPIEYDTEVYTKNDQERIKITPKNLSGEGKTLAITVESYIPNSGNVGTGMDFYNFGSNHYWVTEWYDSLAGIPLVEATNTTTDKNAVVYVGTQSVGQQTTLSAYMAKAMNIDAKDQSLAEMVMSTGLEIGDNLVGTPVRAGEGWQPIDPTRSETPTTKANPNNPVQVQTKITEINKDTKQFKQVFLINGNLNNNNKFPLNVHREPLASLVPTDIISYEVYTTKSTSIDNVIKGNKVKAKNPAKDPYSDNKVRLYWDNAKNNYYYIEVTAKYVENGSVGLGMDYFNNKSGKPNEWTGYWGAQYYNSADDINKSQEQTYDVNLLTSSDVGSGGTLSSSTRTAKAGETVTVTPQVNPGYILEKFEVLNSSGTKVSYTNNGTSYSFTMPNSDVTVKASFKKQAVQPTKHKINTQNPSNGTFKVDKTEAVKGEEVTITPNPAQGYKVKEIYVGSAAGQVPVNNNKFTMPDADVLVRVEFELVSQPQPIEHNINIIKTEGGQVKADKSTAEQGETVKLTITPDNGYQIQALLLLDKNELQIQGSSISNLDKTFTMPDEDVWVKILFKKSETPAKSFIVGKENDGGRGSVVVDQNSAKVGEKVTFTLYPYNVYKATKATVTKNDGSGQLAGVVFDPATNKGYFIMPDISPATGVTVRGVFVSKPAGERTATEERTEILKYKTDITVDESLKPGEKVTDQEGKDGEVKYNYTATYNKATATGQTDVAAPADWPADVIAALKAGKRTGEVITDFARTELSRTEPTNAKVRVGKSDDPIDSFVPGPNDKLVKDGEIVNLVKITNKKAGINPKILKRTPGGAPLPGATFTVEKMTDNTYGEVDKSFGKVTATSDEKGNVIFKDQAGNEVKLQKGYYVIKETKAPVGYKKITAEWKIEIKDDGGRMYAEYQGPEDTPSSLIDDNKKAGAGSSASNELIKYKARLTYIDPEANTYIQRIYIDTRGYYGNSDENTKGLLNLQITPKYKREEIDTPGQSPKTIKDGVKTAYYQSFKLADTTSYTNMDDPAIDKILRTYDLANKDLSLDKTARWRPFDWGFDEDQLNLGKGVYIVEVEGFYDDVIINNKSDKTDKYDIPDGDLGKIDLNLNFYAGAREFQQLYEKPDGTFGYKYIEKGSYQGGAEALRAWIEKTQGKDIADAWAKQTTDGEKYQNFIGKHVKIGNKDYYTGRIYPSLDKPIFERKISANLNPLYNSKTQQEIPREGLEVENEQETYNITFSKHGRDNSTEGINSEKVTKNRLEGAIFQLQIRGPGGIYEDMSGKTVASAFNGYFGFRGLKPGRYRLIEVKAPEGYVPIKGPVLHFTIAYKKGEIDKETGDITPGRGVVTLEYNEGNGIFQYAPDDPKITPEDGKLTDYVTSATAKNMGKIINEKPGKGSVKVKKLDGDGHSLINSKFKLTRITKEGEKVENDGIYNADTRNYNETLTATVGSGQAKGTDITIDPIVAGDKEITGKTIGNSDVTITLPNSTTIKATSDTTGKFIANVPEGVSLANGDQISASINEAGVIVFDNLPIGQYELEEIESPEGYQNKGQKWYFTVGGKGLDPYANDTSSGGVNLTSKLTLDSTFKVKKTLTNDDSDVSNNDVIYPHRAQSIDFENKFTVNDGITIKPGDYFEVKLSDSIDLVGIYKTKPLSNLDIFADGIGTIAKATYDKDKGVIKYVFTEYAKTYTLKDFKTEIVSWINLDKVLTSTDNVPVGMWLNKEVSGYQPSKQLDVIYDIKRETSDRSYSYTTYDSYWYDLFGNKHYENLQTITDYHNITGKIFEMDKDTGVFKQYYYINRMKKEGSDNWSFRYDPYRYDNGTKTISDANIRIFKLNDNSDANITKDMPESFSVNLDNNPNLKEIINRSYSELRYVEFPFSKANGTGSSKNDSYIVEVTGRIPKTEIDSFETAGELLAHNRIIAARWDVARFDTNTTEARANFIVSAINPKNKIIFKKVDQTGSVLKGAKFKLLKYYEKTEDGKNWVEVISSERTSDDKGQFKYEELPPGKYALIETEAPNGYQKIEGHIVEFTVGKNGVITRQVDRETAVGSTAGSTPTEPNTPVTEEIGIEPIEVVNYKDIEFVKVDEVNHDTTLANAEFEVYYKANGTDTNYEPLKVKKTVDGKEIEENMTVTSDKEGKFSLHLTKPGYYALKETKAPEGYSKMPGYIKQFRVENGKVQILEKDPLKASHKTSTKGKITSEILSVDKTNKTFKQRIVINPNHDSLTGINNDSYLRILENAWSITPKSTGQIGGGEVKVALLKKNPGENDKKSIAELEEKDFKRLGAIEYGTAGNNRGSRYSLKELLGTATDSTVISTTDTIVVEYTGKIDDVFMGEETKYPINQKTDLIIDNTILDTVDYGLDIESLSSDNPAYAEYNKTEPIQIENHKATYPGTGGMGTFIFTSCGLALMGLAYLSYRRKRGLVIDE